MTALLAAKPETRCTEQLLWRTEILTGADGSEQRRAYRTVPRQRLQYRYAAANDSEASKLEAQLYAGLKTAWYVPLWPQQVLHTGALSAGATTLTIDTTAGDFRSSGSVLIWQDAETYELATVSAKADASLTVAAIGNSYSGRFYVVPVRSGYLRQIVPTTRYPSGALTLDMTFETTNNLRCTGHTADQTVDNTEVVTTPAYWTGAAANLSHDPDVIWLDSLNGALAIAAVSDYPITLQPHRFIATDRAAAWSLRQRLHAWYGRQKSFFVPTFRRDFRLTRAVGTTDTEIYVADRDFATHYGAQRYRCYVAFRSAGGTDLTVRRITAITAVGSGEEKLTLASAAGTAFATNALCCWVDRCRLASDTVTLDWYLPGRCLCDVQLVRLPSWGDVYGSGIYGEGIYGGAAG